MKILLVISDEGLGEILEVLLKSFKHEVVTVKSAEPALSTIKNEYPDIILIDTNLKDRDGLELSKTIKEDFLTAYIPVIILIDRRQIRKELLEIEQGVDDYIINPPDPIDLQIRIEMAVRRATHQFYANALTRLPGNRAIESILKKTILSNQKFSFGYADIDRFKHFNDCYGYLKGDMVIIQAAQIISRIVKTFGNQNDFVGHIGGDDFVFITNPQKENDIAAAIIKEFDRLIPYHYSKEDRERGFVEVCDRRGKMYKAHFMSITIALINNIEVEINSLVKLSEIAFEMKSYLKTIPGSKFLKNRRIQNKGLPTRAEQVNRIKKEIANIEKDNTKKPLGQLLLDLSLINKEVLEEALVKHWRSGQNLGQTLVGMGVLNEKKVMEILKLQEAVC